MPAPLKGTITRLAAASPRALPQTDDAYLPLRELSRYAGLSVRLLRGYLRDATGPLPHYRVGGKVLVRRSEYDAWARRFRCAGTATVDAMVDDLVRELT